MFSSTCPVDFDVANSGGYCTASLSNSSQLDLLHLVVWVSMNYVFELSHTVETLDAQNLKWIKIVHNTGLEKS